MPKASTSPRGSPAGEMCFWPVRTLLDRGLFVKPKTIASRCNFSTILLTYPVFTYRIEELTDYFIYYIGGNMSTFKAIAKKYNETGLILRIAIGLAIGIILALISPTIPFVGGLGNIFVSALKAIAPVLVFVLVSSSLMQGQAKLDSRFSTVISLYMLSTFIAAFVAVLVSFAFPQTLVLSQAAEADVIPGGIGEVLNNLLLNIVMNPVNAIASANYIGILFWALVLGLSMKSFAAETTRQGFKDLADGVSAIVRLIINFAPFGIMGLIYSSISENGISVLGKYISLILVLVGTMLVVSLVINPIIASIYLKRNAYPLVFKCLKESGLTAFFTRSSAANIPINMELCDRMGLDKDFYSVSIPLGATINMDGAAITITIMTLAAVNTVGITTDIPTAIILSIVATLGACGASGVAGGSLLLIPMACSLYGISNDIGMQVVAVGFIIGVIQDSLETALNSSGDAMFTATAEFHDWIKKGKELPDFMGK